MTRALASLAVLALLLAPARPAAQEPVPLQRNPFVVPESLAPPVAVAAPRRYAAPPPPEPQPEPQFTLRAVLSAGGDSLANIDGRILGVGQTIEGYRLVAIREHQAVLRRGSRRLVLDVFEAPQDAEGE